MVNSVTFDTVVGGDGSTVTDDDNATTGLLNGGQLLRYVPTLSNVVAIANHVVSVAGGTTQDVIDAAASAAAALASENAAAASVAEINELGLATGLQTTGDGVVVSAASPPTTGQVLKATSATTAEWGNSGLSTSIISTNVTIESNARSLIDTSGGVKTITLPAAPETNDVVEFADYAGTWATNNATIASNGLKILGVVQNLILNVKNGGITLIYSGAAMGWVRT